MTERIKLGKTMKTVDVKPTGSFDGLRDYDDKLENLTNIHEGLLADREAAYHRLADIQIRISEARTRYMNVYERRREYISQRRWKDAIKSFPESL